MAAGTAVGQPRSRMLVVGRAAAITAGIALLVKVGLIVATTNTISPTITGTLYVLGVALPLVAAAGLAAGRGGWVTRTAIYLGVVFAHLIFITMLSDGVGALVENFTDEAYLNDEIPVAVLGLVWLVVGVRMRSGAEA